MNKNKFFAIFSTSILACTISINASADSVRDAQKLQRIQPVGQVTVAVDAKAKAAAKAAAKKAAKPAKPVTVGEKVYKQYCGMCHQNGMAGAPKFRAAADWKTRLDQGMDKVVMHAIKGFNSMPAKGTCTECSDKEIRAAVEYMVPQAGNKKS